MMPGIDIRSSTVTGKKWKQLNYRTFVIRLFLIKQRFMDTYNVEFRIYGKTLDIKRVSDSLKLAATTIQKKGQRRGVNSVFEQSMWGYGPSQNGSLKEFASLEDGLNSLFKDLNPIRDEILKYSDVNEIIFWCGHFHRIFGSGPRLSNATLKTLAKFEAIIVISTYFRACKKSEVAK